MKNTILLFGFFVLFCFFTQSCGRIGVSFNPDAAMADYTTNSIIHEDGRQIYCDTPEFNEYACMSLTKWKELKSLLTRIKLDKKTRYQVNLLTEQIDKSYQQD